MDIGFQIYNVINQIKLKLINVVKTITIHVVQTINV